LPVLESMMTGVIAGPWQTAPTTPPRAIEAGNCNKGLSRKFLRHRFSL
jgi:hypothetical protein